MFVFLYSLLKARWLHLYADVQQIALDEDADESTRLEEGLNSARVSYERSPLGLNVVLAEEEDDVDVDELDRQLREEGIDPSSEEFRQSADSQGGNWGRFSEDWGDRPSEDANVFDSDATPSLQDRAAFLDPADSTPRPPSKSRKD